MSENESKKISDEDFKITEGSEKSFKNIIFILLAVSGVVLFFIFRSYLYSILLALFIYVTTRKLNLTLKKKFKIFTPWLMILIVLTSFVLPIYFIVRTLLVKVSSDLSKIKNLFIEDNLIGVMIELPFLTDFFTQKEFFWLKIPDIYQEISENYLDILDFDNLTSIVTNSSSFILGSLDYLPTSFLFEVFFTTLVLFFLYANGREIEQFVLNHIPFSQEIEERIGRRFVFVVQTVVKGNLLISLLQGLVVYLFLIFLKIPAAFLYASIATLFAFIPVIGTAVIWLPVGLYILLIQNNTLTAILYMIFSFLSYLILENYIKPKLLDKNLKVHPMLIFLSLIGGIKEFGIIGIFLGPVSVTFLVIIWDFWNYFKDLQQENKI